MKVFVQHTRVALISQFQHLRNYCITWCTFASIFWILAAFHSITWWEVKFWCPWGWRAFIRSTSGPPWPGSTCAEALQCVKPSLRLSPPETAGRRTSPCSREEGFLTWKNSLQAISHICERRRLWMRLNQDDFRINKDIDNCIVHSNNIDSTYIVCHPHERRALTMCSVVQVLMMFRHLWIPQGEANQL